MTGMDMGTTVGAIDATEVLLRIILLFATAIVAGTGLTRSTVDITTRRTAIVVWIAAVIATTADVFSIVAAGAVVPVAVAQAVLTLAVPVLLNRPAVAWIAGLALAVLLVAETASSGSGLAFLVILIYTAAVVVWFGLAVLSLTTATGWKLDRTRPRVLAGVIAAVLVVAGIGQVLLSGLAFDSRLYQTRYGLALLAVAALSIAVAIVAIRPPREAATDRPPRVYRFGVLGVAAGFLVWSATAAIPAPLPLPVAGAPVLDQVSLSGKQVPVLITPQRPGPNLVHFPASAGTGISVDTGSGHPVTAVARPGAEGTWAEVTLPAGRSDLVLAAHGDQASVPLNTGTTPGLPSAAGPDGPECADSALGTLVAQQHVPLISCPSDALAAADAQALRALIGYLGSRHVNGITIAEDDSPRSIQAAGVVRAAASAAGLPVGTEPVADNALVLVTGWTGAARELDSVLHLQATTPTYGYGLYLAPWLLNPPIVNSVATSSLPLSFDPRVATSLSYSVAVENAFGGENATPDGYERWLAATGQQTATAVQIYAAAQVDAMPMDDMADMSEPYPGQWIPNGTIVPVTGVLGQ